jgi:hypothetical protein
MIRRRVLILAGILAAAAPQTGSAQEPTAAERSFILEGRLGVSDGLGGRSGSLVKPNAITGVSLSFHLSRHWWGWASADYRSDLGAYPDWYSDNRVRAPALELYTLTAGIARTFGLPFLPSRWRPLEIGVGIGATQSEIQTTANRSGNTVSRTSGGSNVPSNAEFEPLFNTSLWASTRWLPTMAARLRMAAPLGPLRLSLTTGITATYVGDVQLWDGGWEPTGEGTRYRPTSTVWSYGTLLTVPLTVGLGFRF